MDKEGQKNDINQTWRIDAGSDENRILCSSVPAEVTGRTEAIVISRRDEGRRATRTDVLVFRPLRGLRF